MLGPFALCMEPHHQEVLTPVFFLTREAATLAFSIHSFSYIKRRKSNILGPSEPGRQVPEFHGPGPDNTAHHVGDPGLEAETFPLWLSETDQ